MINYNINEKYLRFPLNKLYRPYECKICGAGYYRNYMKNKHELKCELKSKGKHQASSPQISDFVTSADLHSTKDLYEIEKLHNNCQE